MLDDHASSELRRKPDNFVYVVSTGVWMRHLRKGERAVTTYPNPGERSEGIGGTKDTGLDTSAAAVTPDEGVLPASTVEQEGSEVSAESTIPGSGPPGGPAGPVSQPTFLSSSGPGVGSDAGSRSEAVKSEASDVKDTALTAGAEVAGTAKEEAGNVAQEVGAQARGLLDQLRSDAREQGRDQKDRIASTLHSLSKELGSMASKSEENGPVTDLAHQASRKGGEIAHWLENHEPADVLDEVKRYARRRPFAFLAICAAAGILAGRLTRGAVAANTSLDSPGSASSPRALSAGGQPGTQGPPASPGPYSGSVGAEPGPSTAPGPYAAGAEAPTQSWPPEHGYGQAPAGTNAPRTGSRGPLPGETGTLNGPPLSSAGGSYGAAEASPMSDESGRGTGEFRP
jgi:uncharacterized protein YjbJ (UPF0337 family)